MFAQLVDVMRAMERHMEEDGMSAAELGQEAEEYAFQRHGCSKKDIERGMAKIDSPEELNPDFFRCFGAWFVYMRHGLIERGYLDE